MTEDIVLLHGWGKKAPTNLKQLDKELEKMGWKTHLLVLPGFGLQPDPPDDWGIVEYANWVKKVLFKKKIKRPLLFGHSFGGQIAAVIATDDQFPISGLILCSAAAVRKTPIHKRLLKSLAQKTGFLPQGIRSRFRLIMANFLPHSDYYQASQNMKKILSTVVNQDLTRLLPRIKVKTLVLWGAADQTLPPGLGQNTHELIEGSGFIIVEGATHSLPYTHFEKVASEITDYFK